MRPLVLLLAGCAPLAGEWSGSVACAANNVAYTVSIDVSLVPGGGGYEGEGTALYAFTPDSADAYSVLVDYDIDLAQTALWGEQALDVDADPTRCAITVDGATTEVPCDQSGFDEGDWSWDGGDRIGIAVDDVCDGTLTRG